jgi:glycosyltransferase involved in cell wall biosynthesis
VDDFRPDIVHSHHPFFMGSTALRMARSRSVPLVFTHHTLYDHYTHYASADTPAASRFIGALAAGYANLCDAVVAPSQSIADLLSDRGVATRIEVIPTGVDVHRFSRGAGVRFRHQRRIPADAFVVGYVGRLAPEKNLHFLAQAVARFLTMQPRAAFVVVGSGPCSGLVHEELARLRVDDRLYCAGACDGQELIDAYHAIDVLAFASQTETQGMVLTEAMAAGKPVVALDGPGVRDVVRDRVNGRLVYCQQRQLFADALDWILGLDAAHRAVLVRAAQHTAQQFSMPRQARRMLELYESLLGCSPPESEGTGNVLTRAKRRIEAEWKLWSNVAQAAGHALEPEGTLTVAERS